MKTNQLIVLDIANEPSNPKSVSQRLTRNYTHQSFHQFLIFTSAKDNRELGWVEMLWSKLKNIRLFKFNIQ